MDAATQHTTRDALGVAFKQLLTWRGQHGKSPKVGQIPHGAEGPCAGGFGGTSACRGDGEQHSEGRKRENISARTQLCRSNSRDKEPKS